LALKQNNEQFLQLADTKLNETRQMAEGELAKRQDAIEQLLKPIGEQLGKYEVGCNGSRSNANGPTRPSPSR